MQKIFFSNDIIYVGLIKLMFMCTQNDTKTTALALRLPMTEHHTAMQ